MVSCEVCDCPIVQGRAYSGDAVVHDECVSKPEFACGECHLIHAGSCW